MRHIVIDDERTFWTDEEVVYLRTADEAILWFAKFFIKMNYRPHFDGVEDQITIWFDHDLGPDSDDAIIVAKFLETCCDDWIAPYIAGVKVHSQNPVGAENLVRQLKWFAENICGIVVERVPLPALK